MRTENRAAMIHIAMINLLLYRIQPGGRFLSTFLVRLKVRPNLYFASHYGLRIAVFWLRSGVRIPPSPLVRPQRPARGSRGPAQLPARPRCRSAQVPRVALATDDRPNAKTSLQYPRIDCDNLNSTCAGVYRLHVCERPVRMCRRQAFFVLMGFRV